MARDSEVEVGSVWTCKISGRIVPVVVVGRTSLRRGWTVRNLVTDRNVTIRTAGRLRIRLRPSEAAHMAASMVRSAQGGLQDAS